MRRRVLGCALLWTALAGGPGCGKGGDGGNPGSPDLTQGGSMVDMAQPDMALGKNQMEVAWSLITAFVQGGTNNGFQIDCDKAGVTMLTFTATNPGTGKSQMSDVPCPAGGNTGAATITLPDVTGPFNITAVAAGKPMSVGEKIKGVSPGGGSAPTVRIYVEGCDQAACM